MEDEINILPPYWFVIYKDDYGQKHIATIKNKEYLIFIENRYFVLEKRIIMA